MRSVLLKQLLEISTKSSLSLHPPRLHSLQRTSWRRSVPLPHAQEVNEVLSFVFKRNWAQPQVSHCVESVCAVSCETSTNSQLFRRLCDYIADTNISNSISTACIEKIITIAAKQQLYHQAEALLLQVISRKVPLSSSLEMCLVEISNHKPQVLLDCIEQMQAVKTRPSRLLFRETLKLCLQHQDQGKMSPIMAKFVAYVSQFYCREDIESDIYCSVLESARYALQSDGIWKGIIQSGLSELSMSLIKSYIKGSAQLQHANTKMMKYLSVILKAHAVYGINQTVETATDIPSSEEQEDMHDMITLNIFQTIILVHEIALSAKSYQYLVKQLVQAAFNPVRRLWSTHICYHLLGGLLGTYDHIPPIAVLVETSKPLIVMNGNEGFAQMFDLTRVVNGSKYDNDYSQHWTKDISGSLLDLATSTDFHLGIKLMETLLQIGVIPQSQSTLKLMKQLKTTKIKGMEYDVLKCVLQMDKNPPQQIQSTLNILTSILCSMCIPDEQGSLKKTPAVSRHVLNTASNKLLLTAYPTHEHCIQSLQALL